MSFECNETLRPVISILFSCRLQVITRSREETRTHVRRLTAFAQTVIVAINCYLYFAQISNQIVGQVSQTKWEKFDLKLDARQKPTPATCCCTNHASALLLTIMGRKINSLFEASLYLVVLRSEENDSMAIMFDQEFQIKGRPVI